MKIISNWKLGLILIIFLAAFLRLWQLGNVPYGIPHDEASYIYNAYSIWHTGKDIESKFLPLSFNAHSSQSPVEVYITAPFVGILGLSQFSARLPSALLGIGSVLLLFLLTDLLFKNKRIALISALLFAISPWALQLGRGLWDADFALFFYLLGIYTFIKYAGTNKILWSILPFILGFYSYHATKIYFVFLILILIFFFRKELLRMKKTLGLFLLCFFLILMSFVVVTKTQSVTRQSEVFIFTDTQAAVEVNVEREKNSAPFSLRQIFNNKPLYFLRIIRENYLRPFSMEYLFLSGDSGSRSQIINIYFRGVLYIIELPLLLYGLYKLAEGKNKKLRNLIFILLFIGALPSAITRDSNFVDRDIMMLPILLAIISIGIKSLFEKIEKKKKIYRILFFLVFIGFYAFLFSSYLYQYYYRWTVYGAEAWGKSFKDIARVISSKRNSYKNIYVNGSTKELLLQYAILNRTDPKIIQSAWQNIPAKIYNITVFRTCLEKGAGNIINKLPKDTLYAASASDCHYSDVPSGKIVDYGEPLHVIWNIYENK